VVSVSRIQLGVAIISRIACGTPNVSKKQTIFKLTRIQALRISVSSSLFLEKISYFKTNLMENDTWSH
jgi:hypothetical protein